jgi:Tfp pilus assembly protein FimT
MVGNAGRFPARSGPIAGWTPSSEETTLGTKAKLSHTPRSRIGGFSVVELVVTLAVIFILCATAVPSLTRTYRIYQLNDSAARLAGMLRLTRFDAIHLNKPVSCQIRQSGSDWIVWADTDGDGLVDPSESQYVVTGAVTLEPDGSHPAPTDISTALHTSNLSTVPGGDNSITFDARGGVSVGGGQPPVYVFYAGDASNAGFGYRAVVLLSSGLIQIWTTSDGSSWKQIS